MRYLSIAFFSGAAVLCMEILGPRILAPTFGQPYLVWVNVIGVTLAALALGYRLGGMLADRSRRLLPWILLTAALFAALIPLERLFLPSLGTHLGIRWGSLLGSLILFAPLILMLGMVAPTLVKLATTDLNEVGRSAGGIFSVSTVGSIVAAFATGFWLIPSYPITHIVVGIVILLALSALIAIRGRRLVLLPFIPLVVSLSATRGVGERRAIFEKESHYHNIRVVERPTSGGRSRRLLLLDGSPQSGKFIGRSGTDGPLQPTDLAIPYISLSARIIDLVRPSPRHLLALGGGGYSIPEYVKGRSPPSEVVVVERDPAVSEVARRFFIDPQSGPMVTVTQDARTFLAQAPTESFDLLYTDAYAGAFSIPWYLATREAFLEMRRVLSVDGIAIFNIASSIEGNKGQLFRAIWRTIQEVFPQLLVYGVGGADSPVPVSPAEVQNIILVASKEGHPELENRLLPLEPFRYRKAIDVRDAPQLTDDYAPTDSLVTELVVAHYPIVRSFFETYSGEIRR